MSNKQKGLKYKIQLLKEIKSLYEFCSTKEIKCVTPFVNAALTNEELVDIKNNLEFCKVLLNKFDDRMEELKKSIKKMKNQLQY